MPKRRSNNRLKNSQSSCHRRPSQLTRIYPGELEKQQAALKDIEEQISARTRKRRTIEGSIESYTALKKSTDQEIANIQSDLLEAGISEALSGRLPATWARDVDGLLQQEIEKLDTELASLKGSEDTSEDPPSLFGIQKDIDALKEVVAKDEVSRTRLCRKPSIN